MNVHDIVPASGRKQDAQDVGDACRLLRGKSLGNFSSPVFPDLLEESTKTPSVLSAFGITSLGSGRQNPRTGPDRTGVCGQCSK